MTTLRRFRCDDLFQFNNVNLDKLTETYNLSFYLQYLATWPELCVAADGLGDVITSYVLGQRPLERKGSDWVWSQARRRAWARTGTDT